MILASVIFVLGGIFTYFLLMPLELYIDSYRRQYYLRMGFLARISVEKDPMEFLRLHLKVLFLNFFWRPSDLASKIRQRKKMTINDTGDTKRGITLAQGRQLLQSFRVKAFRLELDTGNPSLNAQLFPLCYLIEQHGGKVGINFLGRNNIILQVVNRPIFILKAFINPKK